MGNLEIIKERAKWDETIESFPFWDIAHSWGYFDAFRLRDDTFEPVLLSFETDKGRLAYPFFIRKLTLHPDFQEKDVSGLNYLDSIYGYTGPVFADGELTEIWTECQADFREFCEKNQIALIQERFHPLFENQIQLLPESKVTERRKVIICKSGDMEELQKRTYKKNRRYLRLAAKENVSFEVADIDRLDDFLVLYKQTMDQNDAPDIYYFEPEFFERLSENSGGYFDMFLLKREEEVIGAAVCLHSPYCAYGFVMGSNEVYRSLSPTYLLGMYMLDYYHQINVPFEIFGGGRTSDPDDPLLRFKIKYTQEEPVPYYVGETKLLSLGTEIK